jgi:ubiquinol-cytochrome c reductase cytochrome b subunit
VTSPAQPDWYLGPIEGALRLFPSWEIRAFGFEVPNPFFPAVLLPGITVMLLYAWPFIEARFSRDTSAHHLLDDPRDRPLRTALGAATLAFYAMLFFAASNDLIAKSLNADVVTITWIFRVLVVLAPPVVCLVVHRLMKALQASHAARSGRPGRLTSRLCRYQTPFADSLKTPSLRAASCGRPRS